MRPSRPSLGKFLNAILCDPSQKAILEARNALTQFDEVKRLGREQAHALNLAPDILRSLQRLAITDIYPCVGEYRDGPISISNTLHEPPHSQYVSGLVYEMCQYANEKQADALHVSAYLMWRINWIHPFNGGNGRTSRAASYMALLACLGQDLPGTTTVPDYIAQNRQPYYSALDAADAAWRKGVIDVSVMEGLIANLLTQQLQTAVPPAP